MAFFRRALLATTLATAGLAGTTGAAFAHDGGDESNVVNAQGAQVLNQPNACEIDADVLNAVPIDEANLDADVPILPSQGDGNKSADVPNGKSFCNADSKAGAVDSEDSETNDATDAGRDGAVGSREG